MGWLFHPAPAARYHDKNAEIIRILDQHTPLQISWYGTTCYVACKIEPQGEVVALVILTRSYMGPGQRWWGYKDMDETQEPYYWDAPKSLIQKLTPTTNERALRWREACVARAEANARPKPEKFRVPEPLSFTFQTLGRCTAQVFQKADIPRRRNVFKCLDLPGHPLVRLGRVDWSKVEPIA